MADRYEPKGPDDLTMIDYVMSTLENALYSGCSLAEVVALGRHAADTFKWDEAVSLYTSGMPEVKQIEFSPGE